MNLGYSMTWMFFEGLRRRVGAQGRGRQLENMGLGRGKTGQRFGLLLQGRWQEMASSRSQAGAHQQQEPEHHEYWQVLIPPLLVICITSNTPSHAML
jgi:hypothetical protein